MADRDKNIKDDDTATTTDTSDNSSNGSSNGSSTTSDSSADNSSTTNGSTTADAADSGSVPATDTTVPTGVSTEDVKKVIDSNGGTITVSTEEIEYVESDNEDFVILILIVIVFVILLIGGFFLGRLLMQRRQKKISMQEAADGVDNETGGVNAKTKTFMKQES